jgi:tetratricopeptide (TPR) repeat protein
MPAPTHRFARASQVAAVLASLAVAQGARAQSPAAQAPTASAPAASASAPKVFNSDLDARLFYQLLIGEIQLRSGEPGTAYQVLLDAARRTRSEDVFRRATDIALQARAGDQALAAVQAWRIALPESTEALRYQAQLLVAMNRPAESVEPLTELLRLTPLPQRPALIGSLPRFFARSADLKASAELVAQILKPYLDVPGTQSAAKVAVGRSWLAALDTDKALDLARRAHAAEPTAEAPALLALEMLPGTPAAEGVVTGYLVARPDDTNMRLLYVRSLAGSQRYAEAIAQLERLTASQPQLAPPWLTLGALQLELKHPVEATTALKQYVALVEAGSPVSMREGTPAPGADDESPASHAQALTQAWLLLAQAAEQQQDYPAAEGWLARVDNPQRALEVQLRRASMLARQGKLQEARESIRRVPEQAQTDARAKLLAEAQLLRDQKAWADAEQVLAEANQRFADDVDLLYEQAMMDEKLDRVDEMERLLRRVIALKPDHHHAYNALGYSLAERKVRLPEARQLIMKALELSPGEPFITDSLGWVEYRLGNREEAIRLLRGAYQSRPDPEIAAHLGEVLWAAGQVEEARRVWREARSRDATNDVLKETLARLRVEL